MAISLNGNTGVDTAGNLTMTAADPYIRTNADDKQLVLSGGTGWENTAATMVLRGASHPTYNAHGIDFHAGGTERMKIDSAGRVTMPYQPWVTVSADIQSYLPSGVTAYNLILQGSDSGASAYNTSTYRFTAPVSGLYSFSFHSLWNTNSTGEVQLRVNGVTKNKAYTQSDRSIHGIFYYYLNAGDYMEGYHSEGNYAGGYSNCYGSYTFMLVS